MGSVFRKCVTRPVPPTGTVTKQGGKRVARWKNRAGKWATAEVVTRPDGREVIGVESGTYFAKLPTSSRATLSRLFQSSLVKSDASNARTIPDTTALSAFAA